MVCLNFEDAMNLSRIKNCKRVKKKIQKFLTLKSLQFNERNPKMKDQKGGILE
jgi:hypothetical protein